MTNLDTFPLLPAIRPNVASHSRPRTVKVLLMPMLHGCAFPGCSTFTLSTYCVEHELLVRALKESERTHAASLDEHVEDAAMSADPAGETQEPALVEEPRVEDSPVEDSPVEVPRVQEPWAGAACWAGSPPCPSCTASDRPRLPLPLPPRQRSRPAPRRQTATCYTEPSADTTHRCWLREPDWYCRPASRPCPSRTTTAGRARPRPSPRGRA